LVLLYSVEFSFIFLSSMWSQVTEACYKFMPITSAMLC